jgi:hypothetical protein
VLWSRAASETHATMSWPAPGSRVASGIYFVTVRGEDPPLRANLVYLRPERRSPTPDTCQ